MMTKGEALGSVHAAIHSRLFGEGNWLADRESCEAVYRLLNENGLLLHVSDGSSRATSFGNEADVDLLMCFLGVRYEWDVPIVLSMRGYLDDDECDELFEQLDKGEPEKVLKPLMQKAWYRFCNPSGLLS